MSNYLKYIILFSIILIVLQGSLLAQTIEGGTVKYHRIVDLGVTPEGEWAEFKKTLPKTRTTNFILYFSDTESLFVDNAKENEAPSNMMKKAMWFAGVKGQPQVKFARLYHNLEKKIQVKQTEFMTRLFLEESDAAKLKWKMGAATKEILGYSCMQANIEIDGKKILVWFTPDIAVSTGPDTYYGLPGLILEANVNQGQQVWLAASIDLTAPSRNELAKPRDGKKVKSDQYKRIQEDKIEEWEKQQKMKQDIKPLRIVK